MISIDNVSFGYGEAQETLSQVSAAIAPGECVLLCGASGCGKTTVTKLINGLIPSFTPGCRLEGRVFSLNQKVYIQTANGEFLIKNRLYEIEDVLRKQKFLRISNSEIVNIKKITDIDLSIIGRVCIRLSGDICVYVSRRYIPKIKKSLGI